MDSKTNHFNLNHLQTCHTPTTIKTSKSWVLPPRPRPGRKPNSVSSQLPIAPSPPKTSSSNSSSGSRLPATSQPLASVQQIQPQPQHQTHQSVEKPKKTYKKKSQQLPKQQSVHFNNNPVELALKQIKDENKMLKLELSKLVSDLKLLQQRNEDFESLHKKRNHLEMIKSSSSSTDEFLLDQLIESGSASDEDDVSSQISTPSLTSSTSSIMTHSTSSLSSIQENEVLKIDEFLTTSYFDDPTSNSITQPIKSTKSHTVSPMLSPPSLPMQDANDAFEFKFLEQENRDSDSKILKNEHNYDSLFELPSDDPNDLFNWDWK